MGTDIHVATEVRRGGAWHPADKWKDDDGYLSNYDSAVYTGRNYDLFAMLAGVRNGRGFAGVATGSGFEPLAEPRGIPDDVSDVVGRWARDGDHSHSYATVAELLAYDWTRKTVKTGIVHLAELARWKTRGHPESWSGGIGGAGIEVFDADQAVPIVERALAERPPYTSGRQPDWYTLMHSSGSGIFGGGAPRAHAGDEEQQAVLDHVWSMLVSELGCERPHFRVSWGASYSEQAGSFLSETMPRLWRLGAPEDVRIVFWFDS